MLIKPEILFKNAFNSFCLKYKLLKKLKYYNNYHYFSINKNLF